MASSACNDTVEVDSDSEDILKYNADSIPREIKIPKWVWNNVYVLLRDAPNQCLTQQELVVEHSKRFKKSIGGKTLFRQCGVQKLVELLCALPFTDPIKVHGVMKFLLRHPDSPNPPYVYRDKLQRMESKKVSLQSHLCDSDSDFDGDVDDDDEDHPFLARPGSPQLDSFDVEFKGSVPKQPVELLPSWGKMPDELRQKIYHLLATYFKNGVELNMFRDSFTKHFSTSISNNRDCHMQYDEMFYCLKDILEVLVDEHGKMWLKPRTKAEIRDLHATRPPEIFSLDPAFNVRRVNKKQAYFKSQLNHRLPTNRQQSSKNFGPSKMPANTAPNTSGNSIRPARPDQMRLDPRINGFVKCCDVNGDGHGSSAHSSNWDSPNTSFDNCGASASLVCDISNLNLQKAHEPSAELQRSAVNTSAFERMVQSNQRLNRSAEEKLRKSALLNLELWENEDPIQPSDPCTSHNINLEDRRAEIEIKNMLKRYKRSWIQCDNIFGLYNKVYGRPFTFPDSLGKTLPDFLEKFPEYFAIDQDSNVLLRPDPQNDGDVPELAEAITAFGIKHGEVFQGPYKCLQLVEREWLQVLISDLKSNGDFFIQFKNMESNFTDMDIDLSEFYENPYRNEAFDFPDCYCVGLPVVVSCNSNWRRGKILALNEGFVEVLLVDFGECGWVPRKDVRLLQSKFGSESLPPCAVLVGLHNVLPSSTDQQAQLSELLVQVIKESKSLHVVVKSKRQKDGVMLVDLFGFLEGGRKVHLNEEALSRGLNCAQLQPPSSYAPIAHQINDLDRVTPPEACRIAAIPHLNRFSDSDHSNSENLVADSPRIIAASASQESTFFDDQPSTSSCATSTALNPHVETILNLLCAKLNDPSTPEEDRIICQRQIEAITNPHQN